MELYQARYFINLAKTLNFTRAAEACNVTQPALTRAVQRLEDEFGGPLLHRERNLTQLTELGRQLLPLIEQTYNAAETAKALALGFTRPNRCFVSCWTVRSTRWWWRSPSGCPSGSIAGPCFPSPMW